MYARLNDRCYICYHYDIMLCTFTDGLKSLLLMSMQIVLANINID